MICHSAAHKPCSGACAAVENTTNTKQKYKYKEMQMPYAAHRQSSEQMHKIQIRTKTGAYATVEMKCFLYKQKHWF